MQLGPYRVIRRLAIGGMSEIFLALDADERAVAIKLLRPDRRQDPQSVELFEDEARLGQRIVHPHIVHVHDSGCIAGTHYLAMEYVDGLTLAALLQAGPLSALEAAHVASDLLDALSYLHQLTDSAGESLHLVHRDVKPANVLITRDGSVKLADLGIAKHRLRQNRTRTGLIRGTVQYLAPEQVTGSTVDQRTDLYAVGLLLYELLSGIPYIDADDEVSLLRRAEDPQWRSLREVNNDVPVELEAVVERALSRFAEMRFPSATTFRRALQSAALADAADRQTAAARLRQRIAALPELSEMQAIAQPNADFDAALPTRSPPRRRAAALLALSLVVIGLTSTLWFGSTDQPAQRRAGPDALPTTVVATRADAATRRDHDAALVDAAQRPAVSSAPDGSPALRTATTRRRGVARRPTTAAGWRSDGGMARVAVPLSRPAATDLNAQRKLQDRWTAFRQSLKQRGLRPADLSSQDRTAIAQLATIDRRSAYDVARTAAELERIERRVAAIRIDRRFIERKLQRVHALLKLRGAADRFSQQTAAALQSFMDGRYDSANGQLNIILERIQRP